jgi:hypothetical protein
MYRIGTWPSGRAAKVGLAVAVTDGEGMAVGLDAMGDPAAATLAVGDAEASAADGVAPSSPRRVGNPRA